MALDQSRVRSELILGPDDLVDGKLTDPARARAAALYKEHGCLVIHDVFPREFIKKLNDAFIERYATNGHAALEETCLKVGDKRIMVTIEMKAPFDDPFLYANPIVEPLLSELMEGDCVINGFGGVVAFPGALPQPPHRDHPYLFGGTDSDGKLDAELPPYAITMVVPLVDITMTVGPTALWEYSHRSGGSVGRALTSLRAGLPIVPAGDVYLMDYRMVHGGMSNGSSAPRAIMYVIYSRTWFRDTVNYSKQEAIIISSEDYGRVREEHRRLFKLAKPYTLD